MDKQAGSSRQTTRYPHFFQIIVPQNLEDGTLEIPQDFVEEHESYLSKYACLLVSTGKQWRVELKWCNGRVWLHRGWQVIVENCSINDVRALLFKYEGGSFFRVFIFNKGGLEIKYAESSAITNQGVNLNQPKVMKIIEDDGSNEWPQRTGEVSVAYLSKGDDEVHQVKGLATSIIAKEGVLRRARGFQSPNPHFFVIMRSAYHSHLYIPARPGRSYFYGRDDKCIYLFGPNGRPWFMTYRIGGPPLYQVIINLGWHVFAQEYHLRHGDACIFELLNSTVMVFNVTIFRLVEEEINANNSVKMPNIPNPILTGKRKLSDSARLENAKSSQCSKTSFTVVFKVSTQSLSALSVPLAHASMYLLDQHQKQVFLHGVSGQTWPVKCYVYSSTVNYVRLSSGWKDFVVDNDLQEGDACVFQLLSQAPNHYTVTILRTAG
ncbi:hypothetical protein V2J09_022447 [Rumex salicifolius]